MAVPHRELPYDAQPSPAPAPYAQMPVDVVRSPRRRKTVQVDVVDGRVRALVPAHLSQAAIDEHVRHLIERMERRRRRHSGDLDLERLAAQLCRRFDLPAPASVRWVANQRRRWGSCTPLTGEIRLSDRLRPWPRYVVEYVLVHELCHLVVADHSARFHALVARYPQVERAEGFLHAQSSGLDGHGPGAFGCDDDDGAATTACP